MKKIVIIILVFILLSTMNGNGQPINNDIITDELTILNIPLINSSTQTLLFDDINNRLYVGTMMGVNIIEMDDLSVINITWDDRLVGNNTHAFAIDYTRQIVYIGLSGGYGINTYNWSSGAIDFFYPENSPSSLFVETLIYDPISDCLFIGTDPSGLFIHNLTTETSINRTNIHGLPSKQIFSMELDKENNILYVGTLAGLAIYDIQNDSFSVRNTVDGLAENHVFRLTLDPEYQNLYIDTWDTELSVYDIKNDSFSKYEFGDRWPGPMAIDYSNHHLYIVGANAIVDGVNRRICKYSTTNMSIISVLNVSTEFDWPITELVWDNDNNWLYISGNKLGIFDPYYIDMPSISTSETLDCDGNHTVSWTPVDDAEWYTLERGSNVNFTDLEIIYNGENTELEVNNSSEGFYWYRIRGNNSIRSSNWSVPISISVVFYPEVPIFSSLISPDVDGNYTIQWSIIENADYYTLMESNSVDFSNSTVIYNGTNNSYSIFNKFNGAYYYRVMAHNLAGNSDWSDVLELKVTIDAPDSLDIYFIAIIMIISCLIIVGVLWFKKKS